MAKDGISIEKPKEEKHWHCWVQKPASSRGYKMNAKCIECGAVRNNVFPSTTFEGFIRRWVHRKLTDKNIEGKRITQYQCRNYHANDDKIYYEGRGRHIEYGTDTLAIRLPDGRVIGNASRLPRCGSYRRGTDSPAQRVMQQLEMPLIPFNIFEEAKLDLFKAEVVEQGKAEELLLPKLVWSDSRGSLRDIEIWEYKESSTKLEETNEIKDIKISEIWCDKKKNVSYTYKKLNKKNLEKRHFIGAMLLKVEDKYFLFDVDRKELKFYRFNAFLSELPKPCKTIKEAYDMLIPKEVKNAIKKGLNVQRQGEWFFIPAKLPKPIKADDQSKEIVKKRPEVDEFDLKEYNWRFDHNTFIIKEDEIKKHLTEIDKKYHEDHLKRIKEYHEYADKYIKALQQVHREDPEKYATSGELKAGNNNENHVEKFVSLPEGKFVKGKVEQWNREHEPVILKEWCTAVPNTAINSYTIQGNID